MCDFYRNCLGVYIPYKINFFFNANKNQKDIYIYDTIGDKKKFGDKDVLKDILWEKDCKISSHSFKEKSKFI